MDSTDLSSALRAAISGLHKGLRKQISSIKTYSMTEFETVKFLARHESLSPSELATLTRVKTQSMSQILKKMELQGVIERTRSENDGRKVHISLTPAGKEIVTKTRYERDEWLKNAIESSLTKEEKELLAKALPVLQKLIRNN
jgi:DNA-binding MarR family transcriptional regulator